MKEIIKKFKFKGNGCLVINAPEDLKKDFSELGFSSSMGKKIKNKDTLVFVNDSNEFINFLDNKLKHIETDAVLWFAYPKGTSGVKTDINRDTLRITAEGFGITAVTAVSINTTWSALRFRPIDKLGK